MVSRGWLLTTPSRTPEHQKSGASIWSGDIVARGSIQGRSKAHSVQCLELLALSSWCCVVLEMLVFILWRYDFVRLVEH